MKHIITLGICAWAVVIAVGMAINAHEDYKTNTEVVKAPSITSQVKQRLAEQKQANQTAKQYKEVQSEVLQLRAQCRVGQQAYSLLTPYQKLHAVQPVCSFQNAPSVKQ